MNRPFKRRHLYAFDTLFFLFLALHTPLQAQFTFVTNNGAITITGYTGSGGAVTIPGSTNGYPVTAIQTNAFFSRTNITSLTIPGSVVIIPYKAFTQCTGLTNAIINNGTLSIEDHAFYDCETLTNIVIPASVTNIASGAFRYCFHLSTITLDSSNAFYCIVDGVLFNKDQTTLVLHPEALGTSYVIPTGVAHIADYAFASCYALTSIVIPEGVTSNGRITPAASTASGP
jgi:hypothetical protein